MLLNLSRLSTLSLLAEKVLSLSVSLVVFVALANYFSVTSFGEYSYYLALITLLIPFYSLGLNSLLTKELLSLPAHSNVLVNAFTVRALCGFVLMFGLIVYDIYFTDVKYEAEFHLLLLLSVFSAGQVFDFGFQAFQQNQYVIFIRTIVLLLGAGLKFYGIEAQWLMPTFLIVIAAEYFLVNMALGAMFYIKQPQYFNWSLDSSVCKHLLKKSLWLYLSAISAILYLKLDQVMLRQLANPVEVAHYAVASKFTELFYFVPIAIVTAYFPKMIAAAKDDDENYRLYLHRINTFLLYLSLSIVVGVMLISPVVLSRFFIDSYTAALPIIMIQIWTLVFVFQRALLSKWILVEGLLKFSLFSQAMGAIANVALNYWLIPIYGGTGAAWATVISHFVSTVLVLLFLPETRVMLQVQLRSLFWPLTQSRRFLSNFKR